MILFIELVLLIPLSFFFSSRRRHTRCALVTGVQTCALPIYRYLTIQDPGSAAPSTAAAVPCVRRDIIYCVYVVILVLCEKVRGTIQLRCAAVCPSGSVPRRDR